MELDQKLFNFWQTKYVEFTPSTYTCTAIVISWTAAALGAKNDDSIGLDHTQLYNNANAAVKQEYLEKSQGEGVLISVLRVYATIMVHCSNVSLLALCLS